MIEFNLRRYMQIKELLEYEKQYASFLRVILQVSLSCSVEMRYIQSPSEIKLRILILYVQRKSVLVSFPLQHV